MNHSEATGIGGMLAERRIRHKSMPLS